MTTKWSKGNLSKMLSHTTPTPAPTVRKQNYFIISLEYRDTDFDMNLIRCEIEFSEEKII